MGQDSAWWVLDDWIDGETVEALHEKPTKFTLESIKRIGVRSYWGCPNFMRPDEFFADGSNTGQRQASFSRISSYRHTFASFTKTPRIC